MSDNLADLTPEQVEKMLMVSVNRCPWYQLTGMECTMARDGIGKVRLPFKNDLTHPGRVAQGGAIAAVADSAVALALMSLTWPNTKIATIELKINYMKPFKEGTIEAEAKIMKKGKRVSVAYVEVKDDQGDFVAVGLMTYSVF